MEPIVRLRKNKTIRRGRNIFFYTITISIKRKPLPLNPL